MAASATPKSADRRCIAVAYSGGRDSTALLHATAAQARRLNDEQDAGLCVVALHIHHGLSSHADAWLLHCQAQCERWAGEGLPIRLQWHRLDGNPPAGESIEAWARAQRHAALAALCEALGADLLLLAQHRRDQAETLLLQALRGAGVAGLAGMPSRQWRGGLCWARPWLGQPREAVEAYLAAHALSHVDDDSNDDPRYARNRLRLAVWPALTEAFPQAESSLAAAAGWAQQALALQQEIAAEDLARLGGAAGLDVVGLQALSDVRANNVLRAWLQAETGRLAPASLVQRLPREWSAGTASWPCADGRLWLYRGRLRWREGLERSDPPSQSVNLGFAGEHPQVDWGGVWRVERVPSGGVAASLLQDLTLRTRSGGEQFQRRPASALRSLKKAYQEAGVPAWQRHGPLLFAGEKLLFVAGLGVDARMLAASGEAQFSVCWMPASPAA